MTIHPWRRMGILLVILWLVEAANWFLQHSLNQYGLIPRYPPGLVGIITAPFLHTNLIHLISNSIPFFVLGGLVGQLSDRVFWYATIPIVLIGGLATWIFGRQAIHVGASGLIFGWWAFLIFYGIYRRSAKAILIAIVTLIVYGGMAYGLLLSHPKISVESHIFGALAGIIMAKILAKKRLI